MARLPTTQRPYPSNQWPAVLLNTAIHDTAAAEQLETAKEGSIVPLDDIKARILGHWLNAMYAAGNA